MWTSPRRRGRQRRRSRGRGLCPREPDRQSRTAPFKLDSRDSEVAAAQAQAQYAQAVLQIRNLKAAYGKELANLEAARSTVAFTAREAARQKDLAAAGVSSQAQAAEAAHAARLAADTLQAAEQAAAARPGKSERQS